MKLKKTIIATLLLGTSLFVSPAFASETTDTIKNTQDRIADIQKQIQENKKHNTQLAAYIKEQHSKVEQEREEVQSAAIDLAKTAAETKTMTVKRNAADHMLQMTNINSSSYVFTKEKAERLAEELEKQETQQAKEQSVVDKAEAKAKQAQTAYRDLVAQQKTVIAEQKTAEQKLTSEKAQLKKLETKKQEEKVAKTKAAKAQAAKEKAAKEKAAKDAAAAVAKQSHGVDHSNSGNAYEWGQCTWYVKTVAPWVGTYWGNGCQWGASAAADGYRVDSTPEVGAVAVFAAGQNGANAQYGHVGYVEAVNGDGTFTFSQGGLGFANPAGPNYQTLSAAGMQFIHRN